MTLQNRSAGVLVYNLPELNIRRVFNIGEKKTINAKELDALAASDGGKALIQNYLIVDDKTWLERNNFSPPIEYYWTEKEIKDCMLYDSLELFSETLDFAPIGVIEILKELSWTVPLTDLNKIQVLFDKTGFNAQKARENMAPKKDDIKTDQPATRLRK